jgi:hypothetical protein
LPKTDTTTLQRTFLSRHPQLVYLGKTPGRMVPDGPLGEILDGIFQGSIPTAQRRIAAERCRSLVVDWRHDRLVPAWSEERLSKGDRNRRRTRANLVAEVIEDCRVIAVLRRPLDLLESHYFQRLKAAQIKSDPVLRRGHYLDLDDWMERRVARSPLPEAIDVLDYAETLRGFANALGSHRVGVFLFERLVEDADGFIGEVGRFLGLDRVPEVEGVGRSRFNSRWTEAQVDTLKAISASPWRRAWFRLQPFRKRKAILHMTTNRRPHGPGAKAQISDRWRRRVEDETREGNRWIADTWDLPLGDYGYPI